MKDWNESVSLFFIEYVHPGSKEAYTPSGNLTFSCIRNAAKLLLQEKVFDSPDDMRRQAMKDYGITLPESIFN